MGVSLSIVIMPLPLSTVESRYGIRKSPVSIETVFADSPCWAQNSARFSRIIVRSDGKFSRV